MSHNTPLSCTLHAKPILTMVVASLRTGHGLEDHYFSSHFVPGLITHACSEVWTLFIFHMTFLYKVFAHVTINT